MPKPCSRFVPHSAASSHVIAYRVHRQRGLRRGMTLTEMLIAVTVTLVLIAAMVNAFRVMSHEITDSRAILETAGQLRSTSETLRNDLRGVTVPVTPWVNPADGLGYFEYAEYNVVVDDPTRIDTMIGDFDDVLMFTARSTGKPFRGRVQELGGIFRTIESPVAEIAIWTVFNDLNNNLVLDRDLGEFITVYRRTLLVRPDLNNAGTGLVANHTNLIDWYRNNDISVHATASGLVANTLGDLSKRENRFAHFTGYNAPGPVGPPLPAAFPYPISRSWLNALVQAGNFFGEDILISDVTEFDIKAYDEQALVYDDRTFHGGSATVAIIPGDPAFIPLFTNDFATSGVNFGVPNVNSFSTRGAYVDLGYLVDVATTIGPPPSGLTAIHGASRFAGPATLKSQMNNSLVLSSQEFSPRVYDTWPNHYEHDGINQDQNVTTAFGSFRDVDAASNPIATLIDEGIDGFDNPNDDITIGGLGQLLYGADDAGERETAPPYLSPLRGIEITIRAVEPRSQQSRQTSVSVDFVGL